MLLSVKNLSFKYGKNTVLDNICFEADSGHCIAILGNNGAGKSTLVKCINRILSPASGTIMLDGRNLLTLTRNEVAKELAYVAQNSEISRFTVFDTVMLGRKPYIRLSPSMKDYQIVQDIINRMELEQKALSFIDELSGGELQKVMLARALAQEPKVLLLDEPTSSLDIKNQHEMLELVSSISKNENICVVVVLHDLNLALRYCDRFLLLKDNKVFSYGGAEIMTQENIEDVYGIPVTIKSVCGTMSVIPYPERDNI